MDIVLLYKCVRLSSSGAAKAVILGLLSENTDLVQTL